MKIGMVVASMSRRAGGIYHALHALSADLRRAGVMVEVFAGHDDASEEDRGAWGDTPVNVLPTRGPVSLAYQPDLLPTLRAAAPDLIHLHGLWTYPSVATLRWSSRGGPRIISPHGMLDPWALRNSAWKKRVARSLFENSNLRGSACLHALCEPEREAIRSLGLEVPVAVIPNGVDPAIAEGPFRAPAWASQVPKSARVLLFLGRIHPKKGLIALLSAFAQTAAAAPEWHLVIAGWDQIGHEAQLMAQVEMLGLVRRVHFVGPQFDAEQRATLAAADAFVLPSQSEGLPMAVLEAWAFGLPVLMTAECNLPEGAAADAALEVRPNASSIAAGLRTLFSLSDGERAAMGYNGRKLVLRRFNWAQIAADMNGIYSWILDGGPKPSVLA